MEEEKSIPLENAGSPLMEEGPGNESTGTSPVTNDTPTAVEAPVEEQPVVEEPQAEVQDPLAPEAPVEATQEMPEESLEEVLGDTAKEVPLNDASEILKRISAGGFKTTLVNSDDYIKLVHAGYVNQSNGILVNGMQIISSGEVTSGTIKDAGE